MYCYVAILLMILHVNLCFLKKIQCQCYSLNCLFHIFLLQFIVFSGGRNVCLPAVWVQCHGFMTISTDGGAV